MQMAIALVLAVALLACGGAAVPTAQERGTPDITPEEANRIPPPAPTNLAVTRSEGANVISWRPSGLQIVSAYKIYKKTGTSDFKEIAKVKAPPFVDDAGSPKATYAVRALTVYNTESRLSKPVSPSASAKDQKR